MKALIYIGITLGGIVGAFIGAELDGGFGLWSFILGALVGPLLGLWAGYKAAQYMNQ